MRIIDLNSDCLLHIFSFLDEKDLLNVCRAHFYLSDLIEENILYSRTLDLLMSGHRNAPIIQQRTQLPFTYANRLHISRNWVYGRYREYEYYHHAQMFSTKIHLERDYFYITHAGYLRKYKRLRQEPLQRRYQQEIATSTKTDIGDFVKKRDTIFAGRICGNCFIYEGDYATEQRLHAPKEYLNCVDFTQDLYVTSTDLCGKLWRRSEEFGLLHLDLMQQLKHSYKSLKFNECGDRLFGGLYTDVSRRALRELDIESGCETILNSNTISIYDIKLKDENVIFTANFDTTFRMHDRRLNCDVSIWEDPFDSSFYCLEYDGLNSVLCGAKYHSRVNLYDIRVPKKYVQLYFPVRRRNTSHSSPVYSIACDSRYLFIATDHNLRVFDFKTDTMTKNRDYHNFFFKEWERI